jgi:hypothetical protein
LVAGTQSLGQVHDIYGPSATAVIAGFSTQIALPGGLDSFSAEYFSRRSGTMTVKDVTTTEQYDETLDVSQEVGRSWRCVGRPVLLPGDIALPEENPLLGRPATVFLGTGTPPFQAYFPPAHTIGHLARAIERAETEAYDDRRPIPLAAPSEVNGAASQDSGSTHPIERGSSLDQIRGRYCELKRKLLTPSMTEAVRMAWARFEEENDHQPEFLLRICDELEKRGLSISDLLCASSHSQSDSIAANLAYLDYLLQKRDADAKGRDTKARHERGSFRTGVRVPSPGGVFRLILPPNTLKNIDHRQRLQTFAADSVFPRFGGMAVEWERTNLRRKGSDGNETAPRCSNCKGTVVQSGGKVYCPHCGVQTLPKPGEDPSGNA